MRRFATPIRSSPLPSTGLALTFPMSKIPEPVPVIPIPVIPPIEFTFFFTEPVEFYGLYQAQFYEHDLHYTELTAVASIADTITYEWFPFVYDYLSPIVAIDGLIVTITQPDETGFYAGTLSITAMYGPTSIEISVNIGSLT